MFDDPRNTIILISIIICVIAVTIGGYLGHLLKKYFFGKDYKNVETPLGQALSKKKRIIIGCIPLVIALIFAISYQMLSEKNLSNFIIYGSISVIVNMIIISLVI